MIINKEYQNACYMKWYTTRR